MKRRLRSTPSSPQEQQLFDLLFERAFHPLSPEQQRELERLSAQSPDVDVDCYDRAAAAIDLSCREGRVEPMPAHLQAKVLAQAPRTSTRPSPVKAARTSWVPWSGWLVAAAASVVAILGWTRSPAAPPELSPGEARARFLAEAGDAVTLPWQSTADPHGTRVAGDIVWSPRLQRGYMRFKGLPRNESERVQYQLWIFDKPRGTDHPVDGGVFDIASADGEGIVPIDAKLPVFEAAMFAVTEEPRGGVVVSKREHVVALAQ